MVEFRNNSSYNFTDISEKYRVYTFVRDSKKYYIRIDKPRKLHISDSGGHRIFSEDGTSHYIPTGWIHLSWEPTENLAHFSL